MRRSGTKVGDLEKKGTKNRRGAVEQFCAGRAKRFRLPPLPKHERCVYTVGKWTGVGVGGQRRRRVQHVG